MKKYIIILAAAVCALCACQKHEIELLDKPIIEQIDGNTYTYTFSAVISDNLSEVEEDGTKATVSRAGAFAWAENDELKFFKSDGTSADAKITAVNPGGSTATITVYGVDSRADFVSAIYPASAAVENEPYKVNFNTRGPIVVADVTSGTLTFYHIGSLINLKFYEISGMDDIKSLVFEPTTPFNYDGSFIFNPSTHIPSLTPTGTTSKIVIPATKANNNEDITVVVPSVNLSGFSAALNSKLDGSGRNLFKKSTATAHDLATSRPVLMNMKRVAYAAPSKFYVKTTSGSGYWDSSDLRMIQTGANTYDLSLNCDGNTTYYIYDEYNTSAPVIGHIATGLAKSSYPSGTSTWKLVGEKIDGINWPPASGLSMSYEGNWAFIKNVEATATWPVIKFVVGDSWDTEDQYGSGISGTGEGNNIIIGKTGQIATKGKSAGNIYLENVEAGEDYDIFLNTETGEVRVYLSADHHDPNEESGIWTLSFDKSTGVATHARKSSVQDNPFGNADFPTTGYGFKCDEDWSNFRNSTTYNNNSWVIRDITIVSSGSKTFGFSKGDGGFWTALNNGSISTINPGLNKYGTLSYWTDGGQTNATISLESGSYIVYLNVNPDVSGGVNIMFEKQ